MTATKQPIILISAGKSAADLAALFGKRGFRTAEIATTQEISRQYRYEVPAAAIVDFDHGEAETLLRALESKRPPLVIIAIGARDGRVASKGDVDATFSRPVDPARLFAELVRLVSKARKGRRSRNRITGIVAIVDGNELFKMAEQMLRAAVPAVNAPAILEKAIAELGSKPTTLTTLELRAMIESGRLAEALGPFGKRAAIDTALEELLSILG